jgi:hypothetical protein
MRIAVLLGFGGCSYEFPPSEIPASGYPGRGDCGVKALGIADPSPYASLEPVREVLMAPQDLGGALDFPLRFQLEPDQDPVPVNEVLFSASGDQPPTCKPGPSYYAVLDTTIASDDFTAEGRTSVTWRVVGGGPVVYAYGSYEVAPSDELRDRVVAEAAAAGCGDGSFDPAVNGFWLTIADSSVDGDRPLPRPLPFPGQEVVLTYSAGTCSFDFGAWRAELPAGG